MMVKCVTKTLSFTTPTFSMSSILAFFLLLPVSSPQMPRFDLPSNSHGPGSKMRSSDQGPVQCPGPGEVPWCQCREDGGGLSFSCQNMNQDGIARLRSSIKHHVISLQLQDLQPSVTHLSSWMLRNISINNLGVVRSSVKDLDEEFFAGVEHSLVTLSLQHCKLTYVPRGINKITSLKSLDLQGNNISELYPYSFYGASIAHLN